MSFTLSQYLQMSASSQLQMAPQSTLISSQHQQQAQQQQVVSNHHHHLLHHSSSGQNLLGSGQQQQHTQQNPLNNTHHHNNQDSNMSTGSSHSDKEMETAALSGIVTTTTTTTTQEKLPKTPVERKRKRKAPDDNSGGPGGGGGGSGTIVLGGRGNSGDGQQHPAKGPRVSIPHSNDNKKINEYFHSKHATTSPMRQLSTGSTVSAGGTTVTDNTGKSPSPQHTSYMMYPPSPQPPISGHPGQTAPPEFFKSRNASNIVPPTASQLLQPLAPLQPPSSTASLNHLQQTVGNIVGAAPSTPVTAGGVVTSGTVNSNSTTVNQHVTTVGVISGGGGHQATQNQNNVTHIPPPLPPPPVMVSKSVQTELSLTDMEGLYSDSETSKNKVDELTRQSDEQKCQIATHLKVIEQHKSHINKCIEVVKKLLKQKSNIEKKEARQRCMQNRLRLGQFVTQRVGATFQENWTDGYAFQELAK